MNAMDTSLPSLVVALVLQFFANNNFINSVCPPQAARWRGVKPEMGSNDGKTV